MKKLLIPFMILFISITANAKVIDQRAEQLPNTFELSDRCENFAFSVSSIVYQRTGDGFAAGQAFVDAEAFCNAYM